MDRRRPLTSIVGSLLLVGAAALGTAACSDEEAADDPTTTTLAAGETTLVDPPRCERLGDTVDLDALEGVGCIDDGGVIAIPTTAECPDGEATVVFISDKMGLDGGEWREADEDWEDLCP